MAKEVTIYSYLNREEADDFVGDLYSKRIDAIKKGMGIENGEWYYVIVDQSDLELASEVAESFRSKLQLKRERNLYTCTRCHSRSSIVLDRTKFSWWRKFMTRGLIVIQCTRCAYVWYA